MDEGAGHHVFGQVLEQGAAQLFGRDRFAADIGDQALAVRLPRMVFPGNDHHLTHTRAQRQGRFDFTDLDAQTADFHLEVIAAQILQGSVGEPAAEVAGLVQARVRLGAERVGDKAFGAQLRLIQVTPGHADATNVDFPAMPSGCGAPRPSSTCIWMLAIGRPMGTLSPGSLARHCQAVTSMAASVGP